jgi:hypothetical protein
MLEHMSAVINAVQEPTWPATSTRLPAVAPSRQGLENLRRILSSRMMASYPRALQQHYHALGTRRMAAVALALRVYEIDHGRRPATLGALVPDYLPGIPPDPFAVDDRPIGFLPDAPLPILYSVGLDGIDEQGAYQLTNGGWVDRNVKDMPFFLNGDRPRRPSTTPATSVETDDDQGDVEKDQRNPRQDQTADDNP